MTPSLPILLIIFLSSIPTHQQDQCQTCTSIAYTRCSICSSNCDDPNITILLNCTQTSRNQYTQQQCFPKCCSLQVYTFSTNDLDACVQNGEILNAAYLERVKVIAVAVICSGLGLAVLIFIGVKCYQNRSQLHFCTDPKQCLRQTFCCEKSKKESIDLTYEQTKP